MRHDSCLASLGSTPCGAISGALALLPSLGVTSTTTVTIADGSYTGLFSVTLTRASPSDTATVTCPSSSPCLNVKAAYSFAVTGLAFTNDALQLTDIANAHLNSSTFTGATTTPAVTIACSITGRCATMTIGACAFTNNRGAGALRITVTTSIATSALVVAGSTFAGNTASKGAGLFLSTSSRSSSDCNRISVLLDGSNIWSANTASSYGNDFASDLCGIGLVATPAALQVSEAPVVDAGGNAVVVQAVDKFGQRVADESTLQVVIGGTPSSTPATGAYTVTGASISHAVPNGVATLTGWKLAAASGSVFTFTITASVGGGAGGVSSFTKPTSFAIAQCPLEQYRMAVGANQYACQSCQAGSYAVRARQ
ncbi:Uncharacterized protein PBTT_07541 [Plasmodiophora brassicae]